MAVQGPSEVTAGEEAEFSCQVGPAFPKPKIVWTKRIGSSLAVVTEEETIVEVVEMDFGKSQVSKYTLRVTQDMVNQEVELDCAATIPGVGEERSAHALRVTVSGQNTKWIIICR